MVVHGVDVACRDAKYSDSVVEGRRMKKPTRIRSGGLRVFLNLPSRKGHNKCPLI